MGGPAPQQPRGVFSVDGVCWEVWGTFFFFFFFGGGGGGGGVGFRVQGLRVFEGAETPKPCNLN